jgi:hypothetical protein
MTTRISSSNVNTASVVTLTATQTLTNKTIDAAVNTLSNIPNTALVNNTVSGAALGSNLASLSTGNGLSGGPYNGVNGATLVVDNTVVATLTDVQTLSGKTIKATAETVTVTAGAPTAVTNFDVLTQAVQYYTTNATTNFTLNIRGNATTSLNSAMAVGTSMSVALLMTVGATAYYPSAFQVDGTAVSVKWINATAPSNNNASSTAVYSLNIIKTAASTFTVLGTVAQYV